MEPKLFCESVNKCFSNYKLKSSRNNKKMNPLYDFLDTIFYDTKTYRDTYFPSQNMTGRKNVDYTIQDGNRYIFILIKFPCCSYKKNKNNYLENIVGDAFLLKNSNPNCKIVVLNLFRRFTPDRINLEI